MNDLIKVIAVTAELMGTEWSKDAARAVAEELACYPVESVKASLSRCRKELKGRLTLTEILDRLPGGHPGPEEAWSCISQAMGNEQLSLCWTDEMREAYGAAANLSEDKVAARMAFKEVYTKLVSDARAKRTPLNWSLSLGYDVQVREVAAQEAISKGRLTIEQARKVVPSLPPPSPDTLALLKRLT